MGLILKSLSLLLLVIQPLFCIQERGFTDALYSGAKDRANEEKKKGMNEALDKAFGDSSSSEGVVGVGSFQALPPVNTLGDQLQKYMLGDLGASGWESAVKKAFDYSMTGGSDPAVLGAAAGSSLSWSIQNSLASTPASNWASMATVSSPSTTCDDYASQYQSGSIGSLQALGYAVQKNCLSLVSTVLQSEDPTLSDAINNILYNSNFWSSIVPGTTDLKGATDSMLMKALLLNGEAVGSLNQLGATGSSTTSLATGMMSQTSSTAATTVEDLQNAIKMYYATTGLPLAISVTPALQAGVSSNAKISNMQLNQTGELWGRLISAYDYNASSTLAWNSQKYDQEAALATQRIDGYKDNAVGLLLKQWLKAKGKESWISPKLLKYLNEVPDGVAILMESADPVLRAQAKSVLKSFRTAVKQAIKRFNLPPPMDTQSASRLFNFQRETEFSDLIRNLQVFNGSLNKNISEIENLLLPALEIFSTGRSLPRALGGAKRNYLKAVGGLESQAQALISDSSQIAHKQVSALNASLSNFTAQMDTAASVGTGNVSGVTSEFATILGEVGAEATGAMSDSFFGSQSASIDQQKLIANQVSDASTSANSAVEYAAESGTRAVDKMKDLLRLFSHNGAELNQIISSLVNFIKSKSNGSLGSAKAAIEAMGLSVQSAKNNSQAITAPSNSGNSEFLTSQVSSILASGQFSSEGLAALMQAAQAGDLEKFATLAGINKESQAAMASAYATGKAAGLTLGTNSILSAQSDLLSALQSSTATGNTAIKRLRGKVAAMQGTATESLRSLSQKMIGQMGVLQQVAISALNKKIGRPPTPQELQILMGKLSANIGAFTQSNVPRLTEKTQSLKGALNGLANQISLNTVAAINGISDKFEIDATNISTHLSKSLKSRIANNLFFFDNQTFPASTFIADKRNLEISTQDPIMKSASYNFTENMNSIEEGMASMKGLSNLGDGLENELSKDLAGESERTGIFEKSLVSEFGSLSKKVVNAYEMATSGAGVDEWTRNVQLSLAGILEGVVKSSKLSERDLLHHLQSLQSQSAHLAQTSATALFGQISDTQKAINSLGPLVTGPLNSTISNSNSFSGRLSDAVASLSHSQDKFRDSMAESYASLSANSAAESSIDVVDGIRAAIKGVDLNSEILGVSEGMEGSVDKLGNGLLDVGSTASAVGDASAEFSNNTLSTVLAAATESEEDAEASGQTVEISSDALRQLLNVFLAQSSNSFSGMQSQITTASEVKANLKSMLALLGGLISAAVDETTSGITLLDNDTENVSSIIQSELESYSEELFKGLGISDSVGLQAEKSFTSEKNKNKSIRSGLKSELSQMVSSETSSIGNVADKTVEYQSFIENMNTTDLSEAAAVGNALSNLITSFSSAFSQDMLKMTK